MKLYAASLLLVILLAAVPGRAFAQAAEDEGLNIRGRIADLIERFVTDDEEAVAEEPVVADDGAEAAPLDPTIVSGVVGGVAIAAAIMLIFRGYQAPSKPDPFKTRW